jgi:hypothetical protein
MTLPPDTAVSLSERRTTLGMLSDAIVARSGPAL